MPNAFGMKNVFEQKGLERKVRDSCGKSVSRGDPAGAKAPRRLPDRPRKASAWSGNQRTKFLSPQATR
ncbi:hypothetical protein [Bacillus sp. AFS017274]|uniref:hypothetical protein n=1 Tax=Bacillus sp. AFS017274 TaxID=2033488 RepID=UPI000BF5E8CC|nr:hypothetical protein [Bacillus sp. AFS017274]PEZ80209.1 hypothetical protein CN380_16705 [Bacillus sp. AFS017274]